MKVKKLVNTVLGLACAAIMMAVPATASPLGNVDLSQVPDTISANTDSATSSIQDRSENYAESVADKADQITEEATDTHEERTAQEDELLDNLDSINESVLGFIVGTQETVADGLASMNESNRGALQSILSTGAAITADNTQRGASNLVRPVIGGASSAVTLGQSAFDSTATVLQSLLPSVSLFN